jgi:hypothetical protein
MAIMFNATFNTISVISLRSVLLVEETAVPGENHRPAASYWQTLSHSVVSRMKKWFANDYVDLKKTNRTYICKWQYSIIFYMYLVSDW